jgi:mannose-6-phosphate isomerase-like protein (cupin superfamily)
MKTTRMLFGILVAATLSGMTEPADGQQRQAGKNEVTFASSEKIAYTQRMAGASAGTVWGDPDGGAHSAFTKFVAGFDAGMHSHTNDLSLVVLKGAYLYRDQAGEKRVGPGEFLRIPGGHKHWSGADKKEGALFYQHATGKFDLVPAK